MVSASVITASKKQALRLAKTSAVEDRRETVKLLVLTGKQPANKIARQFKVSLQTIYNDMALVRERTRDSLQANKDGTRAEQVLLDALSSTDERIRRLWNMLRENEEEKQAILEGIRAGLGDERPSVNADYAKSIQTYDKSALDTMRQIRAEEDHQAKLLHKFGVLQPQVNVNQKVTVRDDTAMVEAMANAINESIKDPKQCERLKNAIFRQLQGPAGTT